MALALEAECRCVLERGRFVRRCPEGGYLLARAAELFGPPGPPTPELSAALIELGLHEWPVRERERRVRS